LVFNLRLGQSGLVLNAPIDRLLAAVQGTAAGEGCQLADFLRLVAEIHRAVGSIPAAKDTHPFEPLALDIDVFQGVGAALFQELLP